MSLFTALIALALQTSQAGELPYVQDEYSSIERHLDEALRHMISAQTYICNDLMGPSGATAARRRYDALDRRYFSVIAAAEAKLGRRLNLQIWTNACGRQNAGAAFRRHLRDAGMSLEAAEQLLSE